MATYAVCFSEFGDAFGYFLRELRGVSLVQWSSENSRLYPEINEDDLILSLSEEDFDFIEAYYYYAEYSDTYLMREIFPESEMHNYVKGAYESLSERVVSIIEHLGERASLKLDADLSAFESQSLES